MKDSTKEYSFYELISQSKSVIEIPKVQRDYVQGRDNAHAKRVLRQLLKDIKKALDTSEPPLQLQFVYGKENDGRFIPIDGQQRLTTLFLLHIYAFRNDESKDEMLKRFSYDTRATSRDFIQELVKHRGEIFKEMDELQDGSIEDIIVDSPWFNSLAIYDPTVLAMINALSMIYKEFHDCEYLAERLEDCENKRIVFNFLNMSSLGMEDSLYIKLNARGKQLTKFENFKASLFEKLDNVEGYTEDEKNYILSRFDNSWTDIFWQCSKSDNHNKSFDDIFERFFKILLSNLEILNEKDNDILSIDLPEVGEKINKEFFDTLKYLLEYLVDEKNKSASEYEEIYNRTIAVLKKEYTYEDRVLFHMITCFMKKSKGDVTNNAVAYERWTRILRNLIYNTTIDEVERRQKAISSINRMADNWEDLYHYIQDNGNRVDFFETNQVEEERKKVRIILESEEKKTTFKDEIYKAERQQYFKGQIRSALYRAYDAVNRIYDIDKFKSYWKVINLLFDATKPKDGITLCRTLLCYGDYRMDVSAYKTLCVDSVNDSAGTPSMKNLFSIRDILCPTESDKIVSELLDDLVGQNVCTSEEVIEAMNKIILAKMVNIPQNDWRWCFVNYKRYNKLFEYIHRRRMRCDYGEDLLIRNTSSSGLNPDIFLMVIGLEIGSDATNSEYYPIKGVATEHILYFYTTDEEWLYIVREKGGICVKSDSDDQLLAYFEGDNVIDDVVEYCKNLYLS